jgi:riboflavin synthase
MFTGIIEDVGVVADIEDRGDSMRLRIDAPTIVEGAGHGDSISVNGTCLTVADHGDSWFAADVMLETLNRTALRILGVGSHVNLERAARVDGRLGGHIVQGHVDGTATVSAIEPSDDWTVMRFAIPGDLERYLVEKGSVAVDGVSLTVANVGEGTFSVSLIPTTLSETTLGERAMNDDVNIEVDILAKYVEKLVNR